MTAQTDALGTQSDSRAAQADIRTMQADTWNAQADAKSRKLTPDSDKPTISFPGPCNTCSKSYITRRVWDRLGASLTRLGLGLIAVSLLAGCATTAPPAPLADAAPGQRAWTTACADNDSWDKPGPPFRVYGQTYYVGTCGITSLLVVGPEGHTVIDSGTDKGAEVVLANIRALGFEPANVKTILMSHEHFDHVGGLARLQTATGATVVTSAAAAAVLRTGKPAADDPQVKSDHPPFPPVGGRIEVLDSERLHPIAGRAFKPIFTPGHTPGAMSWSWRECEGGACKTIVYVDSLSPISSDGYRFSDHPALVAAFRSGIAKIAAAECDIVITPHPGSTALRARLLETAQLIDRDGCLTYARTIADRLDKRLAAEAAGG